MDSWHALELAREALGTALLASAPLLLTALVVGVLVGVAQTATNLHDPMISFAPRLLAVAAAGLLTAPWMMHLLVEYFQNLVQHIPERL